MTSLVGYGFSSDSESEQDPENRETLLEHETETKEYGGGMKAPNFLLESKSTSSESSSESEQEDSGAPKPFENLHPSPKFSSPQTPTSSASSKLPPPVLGKFGFFSRDSVFKNPFKEQAEERLNVLQKHVPLTLKAQPSHIGGKKVCVAYRKDGRCRFGISCKFAHDSDLQNPNNVQMVLKNPPECTGPASDLVEEPEENQPRKNKHKVGINDSLIPPKRALKQYAKQKNNSSI